MHGWEEGGAMMELGQNDGGGIEGNIKVYDVAHARMSHLLLISVH